MTCIVGLVDNGKVYIGGDSAGVGGMDLKIRTDKKVFFNKEFIIGFTSSFRMGQILQYKFSPPKQKQDQEDYEYMVTNFIDEVKNCFSENGFDEDGEFLVGYRGNLYAIHSDFQVAQTLNDLYAVGCGSDLALGSLFSTPLLDPTYRVKLSLQAAESFSAGVSSPFVIESS
jgi:ATP-dependent protease HslVU (ClpYQ) peptidase subunit